DEGSSLLSTTKQRRHATAIFSSSVHAEKTFLFHCNAYIQIHIYCKFSSINSSYIWSIRARIDRRNLSNQPRFNQGYHNIQVLAEVLPDSISLAMADMCIRWHF
ncbi:unnamed protein product, partial [Callosobruchus maculatus]